MVDKTSSRRDWLIVAVSWAILLVSFGAGSIYPVFIPVLESDFGWSRTALAAAMSVGYVLRGVTAPLIGLLVDKIGVFRPALVGFALTAGSLAALAGSTTLWQLYLFFGVGLSLGIMLCSSVLTTALVARFSRYPSGFAYSVVWTGHHTGRFIFPIAAAFLLSLLGLRGAFLSLAFITGLTGAAISTFLFCLKAEEKPVHTRGQRGPSGQRIRFTDRFSLFVCAGYIACGYTDMGLIITHIVAFATDMGMPLIEASAILGLIGLSSIFGTLFFGLLSRRWGPVPTLTLVYALRLLAFGFLLSSSRLGINVYSLAVFCVLLGTTICTQPLVAAMTASHYGREAVGRATGALNSAHWAGGAIGAFVGGLVYDLTSSYELAFLGGFALLLMATLVTAGLREPAKRSPDTTVEAEARGRSR